MNARELAVDLSFLRPAEREQLLGELPPQRRAELSALLQEISGLQKASASFEAHMTQAESSARTASFAHLNDGQLRLLLSAEHPAVQRRILTAVRSTETGLAPTVAKVLADYLDRKVQANDMHAPREQVRPRRWWLRWRRATQ